MHRLILWFRILLVVAAAIAILFLFVSPLRWHLIPYLGIALSALFLWMVSEMALDLRTCRYLLEQSRSPEEVDPLALPVISHSSPQRDDVLLDMTSFRRLGDRIFKADGTKTCQNCKYYKGEEHLCLVDGVALGSITVSAVGCQHWLLGLKVTETHEQHPSEEPEIPPPPPR
jgi:hypothetical protein